MKLDLANPDPTLKRALAAEILGGRVMDDLPESAAGKTVGLVTFYLHCIGSLVDAFNVNTHDSFDVMRTAFFVVFRHVLDIDENSAWPRDGSSLDRVVDYRPLAGDLPEFRPVQAMIASVQTARRKIYDEETKSGPALLQDDAGKRAEEFTVLHGDLVREIFGTDYSSYVWPRDRTSAAGKDYRLENPLPESRWRKNRAGDLVPEVRLADGNPLPEIKNLQSGDIWVELGTGLGSLFISLSTVPAPPKDLVKSFLTQASIWDVAREKLYGRWTATLRWATETQAELNLVDVPPFLKVDAPGAGIDYRGFSHAGLVEKYGDDLYPELTRADFVDAFPNRMRQTWRAHGFGFSHARRGGIFRLREDIALDHVRSFTATKAKVEARMVTAWQEVPGGLKRLAGQNLEQNHFGSFPFCRKYLTGLKFPDFDRPERFLLQRHVARPVYEYCRLVFQQRGLDRFQSEILNRGGAKWSGAKLVEAMGELAVEVARDVRNQREEYAGIGTSFDDHFDSMTKSGLYCVELVENSWLLGTGLHLWPEARFKRPIREALKVVPEQKIADYATGFLKIPYAEEDSVFAPQDILDSEFGREHWRALLISNFAFFGTE